MTRDLVPVTCIRFRFIALITSSDTTLENVSIDLLVFTGIAGTS